MLFHKYFMKIRFANGGKEVGLYVYMFTQHIYMFTQHIYINMLKTKNKTQRKLPPEV